LATSKINSIVELKENATISFKNDQKSILKKSQLKKDAVGKTIDPIDSPANKRAAKTMMKNSRNAVKPALNDVQERAQHCSGSIVYVSNYHDVVMKNEMME
jgi:hypothetical protein